MKNKVVFISGAASGIGKQSALTFAKAGAKLAIADISPKIHQVGELIQNQGTEVLSLQMDVAQLCDHQAALLRTIEYYGRIDCAFNNAGIEQHPMKLNELLEEDYDRIMSVNLKGIFLAMKVQIPQMIKQGGGVIVNTASVAALKGVADISVYSAAKAGIVLMSRSAAIEYATQNIRINVLCPGLVMTEMAIRLEKEDPEYFNRIKSLIPMARGAIPEEVAQKVLWLCQNESSFMTGQCIVADDGYMA